MSSSAKLTACHQFRPIPLYRLLQPTIHFSVTQFVPNSKPVCKAKPKPRATRKCQETVMRHECPLSWAWTGTGWQATSDLAPAHENRIRTSPRNSLANRLDLVSNATRPTDEPVSSYVGRLRGSFQSAPVDSWMNALQLYSVTSLLVGLPIDVSKWAWPPSLYGT